MVGCVAAFLTDLVSRGTAPSSASLEAYWEAAVELMAFEDRMPIETYYFPSKCKVAWGAGRLLEEVAKLDPLPVALADQLYRIGRRTFQHTMLGTMRPNGTWGDVFYPLLPSGPEVDFDYRTLAGISALPDSTGYKSETACLLPGIEVTGEFLAELLYLQRGVAALRARLVTGG